MRALITGAAGQLGRALVETAPADVEVFAYDVDELDVTDARAVDAMVRDLRPDLIVNAAAYTAIDRAERERPRAKALNTDAVGYFARAAQAVGGRLLHVSTDFVFDGLLAIPYGVDERPAPLGVYGQTKLEGEWAAGPGALIVRSAWVYGATGRNFVRTMLARMTAGEPLRVVADQVGTPTFAPSLADALWKLSACARTGILHYTDSGVASLYDWAVAIQEEALAAGLLAQATPIRPIRTEDWPTPAPRPRYAVLDKTRTTELLGEAAPHWRVNLRRMIAAVRAEA